jgi:hypothetical protein
MDLAAASEPRPRPRGPTPTAVTAVLLLATFWAATLLRPAVGEAPRHLEARLRRLFANNAPGLRVLAVPMNGLLHLFGERRGSQEVLVADSTRWGRVLFLAAERELESASPAEDAIRGNVDRIRARVDTLRDAGVARVLLLPVPTKLSVFLASDPSLAAQVCEGLDERSSSGGAPTPAVCDGRRSAAIYERVVTELQAMPSVEVVELQRALVRHASEPLPLFAYDDTHWTSLGLAWAASATLEVWRGAGLQPPVKVGTRPDAPGDLQYMLALPEGRFFRAHAGAEDLYDLPATASPGSCERPVFLLGDSYSNCRGQSLARLLTRGSGCNVVDLSVEGDGPVASFPRLHAEQGSRLQGATVLWEFPIRELTRLQGFAPH